MWNRAFFVGLVLGFVMVLSGCVVRVYQKEMPRKDIVVEGNQGYLVGNPPRQGYTVKKKTRKIIVTEIELVNPKELHVNYLGEKRERKNVGEKSEKEGNYGYIYKKERVEREGVGEEGERVIKTEEKEQESGDVSSAEEVEQGSNSTGAGENAGEKGKDKRRFVIYKVQKGDTLQKISYKFYGRYSWWPKIFAANKDRLENPDSIYVGQELRIPVLDQEK